MSNLLVEINAHIATVSINRPLAYNALNTETLKELETVCNELNNNDDVSIVVFTGVGKAFVAGADISEMRNMTEREARIYSNFGSSVFLQIERMNKLTIAAVNGFALGGGNELAMACDLRLASPKAKFGQPEVTLGITPGFSGTLRLQELIGLSRAKELLYSGKIIDAAMGLNYGLVNSIIEDEDFLKGVYDYCKGLLKNSFNAQLNIKRIIHEGLRIEEKIAIETNYFANCFLHGDQKEGMSAFLEKRPANYKK